MHDSSRLAHASLLVAALGFGIFGIALLLLPHLLGMAGVQADSSSGVIELRAFYGGLELGLAAFFLTAMRRPKWVCAALFAQVAAAGGIAGARVLGIIMAGGEANAIIYLSGAGEAAVALLGLAALWRNGERCARDARAAGTADPPADRRPHVGE